MVTSPQRFGLDHLIDRPSLRSALDGAFERRLSLIVAPAGAGKTTLLRQWSAAHRDRDFVFLDIEAADDHPVHFTRRLVAGLAGVGPALSRVRRLINVPDEGRSAPLIDALATELETLPDVVIIVDDVHRFSNIHPVADLGELAERTPANVHLVVSSRSDPPIALSRYRLHDELLELRQAELAFSEEETAELVESITGHPLNSFNARALRERTEGWAAGLQLAGLSLRHERDPDAFIADFGGSDRLVADYLGEEVLALLPEDQRELLLRMSALDDMCAGLVRAATGCDDAQSVLENLERDSMFLVQLDNRREWFRFHHLFRDLLRSRLRAEGTGAERRILGAAADWHLARSEATYAIEYLLRAQLWDRALEAIFANAEDVIARGDMLTVVRWMLRIPERWRSRRVSEEILSGMRPRAPTAPLVNDGVLPAVLFEQAMTSLARGDTQQARGIAGAWDELVPRPEPLSVIQRHILLAGVAISDNAQNEGTRQLSEAVRVAEIYGFVGVFARAGPMILNRLPDVAGPQAAFRDIILARAQKLTAPGPDDLPDPLTDRELEILSYLPTRFTNGELAERCFVSVNTIKTHMAHIYRKLDATDRDAAIDRARVLGLL